VPRSFVSGVGLAAIAAGALALVLAASVRGGVVLDRAAEALEHDPVYVDPEAQPTLTPAEERRLEDAIDEAGEGPIYIAVLPAAARAEAGGDGFEALRRLALAVDRRGAYALAAGGELSAGATGDTGLAQGEAARLAAAARRASSDEGLAATLVDFVERVGAARADQGGAGESGAADEGGGGFPWWLVVLGGGALAYMLVRLRRRENAERAELAEVKEAASEDLVALASDVQALEEQVEQNPRAKQAYLAALDHYARASSAFDWARTPKALEPVAHALEEGRYEMAVARAELAGEPPPERRAPCFFDPRHGPSVCDVALFGAGAREVPACAACALRIDEGEQPEPRRVLAGGRPVPYFAAGPAFGSYFGGFFPGLVLGQVVAGGFGDWGAPPGLGANEDDAQDEGQDGDEGWGDTGDFAGGLDGGDFGGGDFGGE
jgi:hypothetical protein